MCNLWPYRGQCRCRNISVHVYHIIPNFSMHLCWFSISLLHIHITDVFHLPPYNAGLLQRSGELAAVLPANQACRSLWRGDAPWPAHGPDEQTSGGCQQRSQSQPGADRVPAVSLRCPWLHRGSWGESRHLDCQVWPPGGSGGNSCRFSGALIDLDLSLVLNFRT